MTRVDLITGFLGAGKTTFIHKYLRHLADQRVLIIENEYGSVSVDSQLLRNEGRPIEDLAGVCMCCKGRDQFRAMLIDAAAQGCDRVLVEPSGVYDVDEFFGVMDDPAVRAGCEIGCVLAIVDAAAPEGLSEESEYLMFTQLAAAGTVVLSKAQRQTPEELAAARRWLDGLCQDFGGHAPLGNVCAKPWDALTDEDFERFQRSGFNRDAHERRRLDHNAIYSSYITAGYGRDGADLEARLRGLMSGDGARYGRVIRAKGYLRDLDKRWYEVNCTRADISVRPAEGIRRGVLVVIGQDLREDALDTLLLPRDAAR